MNENGEPERIDDDALLSAFIDGELDESERQSVEARLESDHSLRARLAALRDVDAALGAAFDLEAMAVPASVTSLLETGAEPESNAGAPTARAPRRADRQDEDKKVAEAPGEVVRFPTRRVSDFFAPAAIAASVALMAGYVAGSMQASPASGPGDARRIAFVGALGAEDPIAAALSAVPSGQTAALTEDGGGAAFRPVLSFRATDGSFCREFEAGSALRSVHGVACRDAGQWTVRAMISGAALDIADGSGFQTASAADAALIADFIDGVIEGDPFDLDDEAAALEDGADEN